MKLSKASRHVILAYDKGYRVIDGEVSSPKTDKRLKAGFSTTQAGYKSRKFTIRGEGSYNNAVYIHRLVAYQKYGMQMFKEGLHVRHLDGNSLNNSEDNIAIGTSAQNSMDRSPSVRKSHALKALSKASLVNRRFSDAKIKEIRATHTKLKSYKKIKEMYNISSSGGLHYMLNHDYVSSI